MMVLGDTAAVTDAGVPLPPLLLLLLPLEVRLMEASAVLPVTPGPDSQEGVLLLQVVLISRSNSFSLTQGLGSVDKMN